MTELLEMSDSSDGDVTSGGRSKKEKSDVAVGDGVSPISRTARGTAERTAVVHATLLARFLPRRPKAPKLVPVPATHVPLAGISHKVSAGVYVQRRTRCAMMMVRALHVDAGAWGWCCSTTLPP